MDLHERTRPKVLLSYITLFPQDMMKKWKDLCGSVWECGWGGGGGLGGGETVISELG